MKRIDPELNTRFKNNFHFDLPESLFEFWLFWQQQEKENQSLSLKPINLRLSNLFNIFIEEKENSSDPGYFDDTPEWLLLLDTIDMDGLHWGYFIESYNSIKIKLPVVSATHSSSINMVGNDLFEALHDHLTLIKRTLQYNIEEDKEYRDVYKHDLEFVERVAKKLEPKLGATSPWNRKSTIKTRDGYGIALDPAFYKALAGDDQFLNPGFKPGSEEVALWQKEALLALEEGYPLTALKLGRDLWRYPQFSEASYDLLKAAYHTLNESELLQMLEAKHRFRKTSLNNNMNKF